MLCQPGFQFLQPGDRTIFCLTLIQGLLGGLNDICRRVIGRLPHCQINNILSLFSHLLQKQRKLNRAGFLNLIDAI